MQIKQVEFIKSSQTYTQCPVEDIPEYAFVGRSNVGKSSLINFLTGRNRLAKTSNTPGRTRLINHFKVDDQWNLVDLPGYGYAKISKTEREKFEGLIKNYLLKRQNLTCLFLLIDSRHEPQKIDLEYIQWLGEHQIPFVLCFTKTDKLSQSQFKKSIENYQKKLQETWEELPRLFYTSVHNKLGREDILEFIANTNMLVKKQ